MRDGHVWTPRKGWRLSIETVGKFTVHRIYGDLANFLPLHHAFEKLGRNVGQHGVGDNRVNHPPPGFELLAARYDGVDDAIRILERDTMRLAHPLPDPVELQPRDLADHVA